MDIAAISQLIQENINGRRCVFWGRDILLANGLIKYGIAVDEVYTSNKDLVENDNLYLDYKLLNGRKEELYVVMPFIVASDSGSYQVDTIQKFGYSASDYLLIPKVGMNGNANYKDEFGNVVNCNYEKASIHIEGENNIVKIDAIRGGGIKIIVKGNNNNVSLYRDTIKGNLNISVVGDENKLNVSEKVCFNGTDIALQGQAEVNIEKEVSFNWNDKILAHPSTNISIGTDCMLGIDVLIQSGDCHSVFDIHSGKNINSFTDAECCKKGGE